MKTITDNFKGIGMKHCISWFGLRTWLSHTANWEQLY
jgi:hypothetical protein